MQIEGVAHVIKQLTNLQQTPDLPSPTYIVLKKTKEYEIRQYSSYLVAETSMASGTRPAGGDGFTNLAGYIFGGNSRSLRDMIAAIRILCWTCCLVSAPSSFLKSGCSRTWCISVCILPGLHGIAIHDLPCYLGH